MKKSAVAGLAGAVRIDQLTMAKLTYAERHGKRLDETGKSRAINNNPPLTTSGLDLKELFHAHVAGAFVPKARAKAMHVIVQFPKDLVDGDDANLMLQHARAFIEKVFGRDAIFADRVDRDEEGRHIVDVFIAPKYIKKTKHDEKVAVSVSRHQKLLAEKYGFEKATPRATGQALQQALFEYLRDDMGLVGVMRGDPKLVPGRDWKLSEQLRMDELAEQQAEADAREAKLEIREQQIDALADKLDAREERITERLQHAEQAAAAADADRAAQAIARSDIERASQRAEEDRRAAAVARDHAVRLEIELGIVRDDAIAASRRLEANATTAEQNRRDTEAAKTAAIAERDELAAARLALDKRRKLQSAQIALLARAADEDNGLNLHLVGDSFSIRTSQLSEQERVVKSERWSPSVVGIARALANALDRLRNFAELLGQREKTIADREAELKKREADLARDRAAQNDRRAEQDAAVARLDRERCEVEAAERRAETAVAAAAERLTAADARHREADAALMANVHWTRAMAALEDIPDAIRIDQNGALVLDRRIAAGSPDIARVFQNKPPVWVVSLASKRIDLANALEQAREREHAATDAVNCLTDMIKEVGPVLTPVQQSTATKATQIATQFGARYQDIGG